jgi:hypothetical protein
MRPRFPHGKEEVLADCHAPPPLFRGVLNRTEDFARPFAASLPGPESRAHSHTSLVGSLPDIEGKNAVSIASRYDLGRWGIHRFIREVDWDPEPPVDELSRQVAAALGGPVPCWSKRRDKRSGNSNVESPDFFYLSQSIPLISLISIISLLPFCALPGQFGVPLGIVSSRSGGGNRLARGGALVRAAVGEWRQPPDADERPTRPDGEVDLQPVEGGEVGLKVNVSLVLPTVRGPVVRGAVAGGEPFQVAQQAVEEVRQGVAAPADGGRAARQRKDLGRRFGLGHGRMLRSRSCPMPRAVVQLPGNQRHQSGV